MSGYLANIPQPNNLQSVSQGQFLTNFGVLNSSYGVDHYDFTISGANTGFHKKVTTPPIIGGAPAIGSTPIFYAFQPTANAGPIHYSLGTTLSGPATPLTSIQSPTAGISVVSNAFTPVFDFTGVNQCIAMVYANGGAVGSLLGSAMVGYYSGTLVVSQITGVNSLPVSVSGNVLYIKNNTSGTISLFWTLQFLRIQ